MSRITGFDAANLIEAYNAVYAPQEEVELTEEQVQEDFENWVNSLVEEGHDLSEYTWEEMYEEYLNEVIRPTTGQQTAPRPTTSPRPTPAATGYNPAGGGMGGARGSRGPVVSQRPAPSRFGTTTPKGSSVTSTGVSGLSAADRAAYSAGGGNAAAQRGMGQTTSQVIAQGRANLGRMDQGRPAPARPVASAPASTRPVATAPARPAATAPAAPRPTPAATAPSAPAAPRPSLAQQTAELRKMRQASQQRQIAQGGTPTTPLVQSFDPFDIVMGYLIDEGYAETEEAATVIMTNMSEEWREEILDEELTGKRKTRAVKKFNSQNENPGNPDTNLAAVATMRHGSRSVKNGNSNIYPADGSDTGNRPTKRGGSGVKGKAKTGYYDGGDESDRGSGNAAKRRMKNK